MSDYKINQINNSKTADSDWKALFIAGGAAPLVTLAFYLISGSHYNLWGKSFSKVTACTGIIFIRRFLWQD